MDADLHANRVLMDAVNTVMTHMTKKWPDEIPKACLPHYRAGARDALENLLDHIQRSTHERTCQR